MTRRANLGRGSGPRCVCGHRKSSHPEGPTGFLTIGKFVGAGDGWHCFGEYEDPPGVPPPEQPTAPCPCEGYERPARRGEPLVFGTSRLPRSQAEAAPAWPPLEERAP